MHRVRDVMSHHVVYAARDATVRTAVEILRSHPVEIVPVVEEGRVVGVCDALTLSAYDGDVLLREVIREPALTVDADSSLSAAAMHMRARNLRQVPVVQEGCLVGFLSDHDLLMAWGTIEDPLTGLPVQHLFRRWAMAHLAAGRELAILFVDLNDFGTLNKRHGHVVGDVVIQRVADALRESIDPRRDYLCRYGGDEFAIGTLGSPETAYRLAEQIRERVARIAIDGAPAPVSVAIGLAGGQRLHPRPGTHSAAMLDDLLTQASTASTHAKGLSGGVSEYRGGRLQVPRPGEGEAIPPRLGPAPTRVAVARYQVGGAEGSLEVSVELTWGHETRRHQCAAERTEPGMLLALATSRCVGELIGWPEALVVEETYEYTTPQGVRCVGATVSLARGGVTERLVGTAAVRDDPHRAYINAVLDATNRRLLSRSLGRAELEQAC